jgi:hypothetical protein
VEQQQQQQQQQQQHHGPDDMDVEELHDGNEGHPPAPLPLLPGLVPAAAAVAVAPGAAEGHVQGESLGPGGITATPDPGSNMAPMHPCVGRHLSLLSLLSLFSQCFRHFTPRRL